MVRNRVGKAGKKKKKRKSGRGKLLNLYLSKGTLQPGKAGMDPGITYSLPLGLSRHSISQTQDDNGTVVWE